jgi:homoserine dehydrogenase
MEQVILGMIGGGTVGGGVFQALRRNGPLLASRLGTRIVLKKIAVKAFDEPRKVEIPEKLMTTKWHEVVEDPEIQVVAELAGGTTVAREITLAALRLGKPVVTANKCRRRHPHHQSPARRVRRQPHHPPLRHRQRHV